MKKQIYLIRHGLIDYITGSLNEQGIEFSKYLVELFEDVNIDKIYTSNEPRCIDTILPLAEDKKIQHQSYDKYSFIHLEPLINILNSNNRITVICYRIEKIHFILQKLGHEAFSESNRDSSYEKIIKFTLENNSVISTEYISTKCKKPINKKK